MWKKYFKVIKIVPGRVITPGFGSIDLSSDNIPVETIKELYEHDFPYLEITEEGKEVIYNIKQASTKPSEGSEKEIETPEYFTPEEKVPVIQQKKNKSKRKKKNSATNQK